MSSADQVTAVLFAAAQAVSKVFVIGGLGWLATQIPRGQAQQERRLLPMAQVPMMARFSFHMLTLPLIYSTTAQSVNADSIGQYWFLIAGALYVLMVSYGSATVLGWMMLPRSSSSNSSADFVALRIAATFPNIVALPILIFPSLCEFAVVHEGYYINNNNNDSNAQQEEEEDATTTAALLQDRCQVESTTMIFAYFFSWSLAFWMLGYPQLLAAAAQKRDETAAAAARMTMMAEPEMGTSTNTTTTNSAAEVVLTKKENTTATTKTHPTDDKDCSTCQFSSAQPRTALEMENDTFAQANAARIVSSTQASWCQLQCPTVREALSQTFTSPGFLALLAGIVTGFIPPLQKELFEPAGALRFLGDAVETVGQASNSMSTMVVAASLVPMKQQQGGSGNDVTDREMESDSNHTCNNEQDVVHDDDDNDNDASVELVPMDQDSPIINNPIMSDPNFGPVTAAPRRRKGIYIDRLQRLSRSIRRGSANRLIHSLRSSSRQQSTGCGGVGASSLPANNNNNHHRRHGTRRLLLWFVLSRLFVAPVVMVGTIVGLDCGSAFLQGVPNLAKLVVIVNSCLPGALIVVVLLQSNPSLSESAAVVAQVYLPSYLLSIVSIAAWTALGLYVTLPDEEGKIFCHR